MGGREGRIYIFCLDSCGNHGSSDGEEGREWVVEKVLFIYSLLTAVETGGVRQVLRKLKHSCQSMSSYCPLTPNS